MSLNTGTERYFYMECDCRDSDHLVRFYADDDPEWRTLGVSVQLSHYLPWWRRILVALDYIFGPAKAPHFVDAVWTPEQIAPMIAFLNASALPPPVQPDEGDV